MQTQTYKQWLIYAITLCAGLGGVLYGYDIGVISGALPLMQKTITLSLQQQELIVGGVLAGSLLGTLFTGAAADRYGRRAMILLACIIFACGVSLIIMAHGFASLICARLLLGLGVGVISVAVPLYLSEIAPAHLRGRSVAMFQIFLTFGIMLAYLVDLFFTQQGNWRAMFALILVPTLVLFVSMLLLPETPRWLLSRGKERKARKILQGLRPAHLVEIEIQAIQAGAQASKSSWRELLNPVYAPALFVALTIAVCNQLTGINVILQYAPIVMHSAGLSSGLAAMMATLGIGTLNFLATLVSMALVDVIGRKRLLIFGTGGVIMMSLYLALCSYILPQGSTQATFVLLGLLAYIVCFAVGPGVIVWLAISELLPTKVRGKTVALCLFVNGLTATVLSSCFLSIQVHFGMGATYLLFAACTCVYFVTAKYFLPETNNRNLEDIQHSYHSKSAQPMEKRGEMI